jgi:hypothetical protein
LNCKQELFKNFPLQIFLTIFSCQFKEIGVADGDPGYNFPNKRQKQKESGLLPPAFLLPSLVVGEKILSPLYQ